MSDDSALSQSNLIPVDILTFRNVTREIDFDVYLKLSQDNVAHVFSKSTGIDYKRLAQYIQKGIKELYILPQDQEAYQRLISRTAETIFNDPNTSAEKKVNILLNMTEQNMEEIFSQFNIETETAEKTQIIVKDYVDLMVNSPQTLTSILKMVSHGNYLYSHSIATAIFSMFIARVSGQFNQRMLELVGLGGFLHDIGCTQLPKDVICSPTDLTQDQWIEMHSHPKVGLKMIEKTRHIPDEVRYIVYQHHEAPNGNGYPNGVRNPVIYYPAKIVGLADALSALVSKRPFRPAYSIEDAIRILQESTGKFDRDLVKILPTVFLKAAPSYKKSA